MKKTDLYIFGIYFLLILNKLVGPEFLQISGWPYLSILLSVILFAVGIATYRPNVFKNALNVLAFAIICSLSFSICGLSAIMLLIRNYDALYSLPFALPCFILIPVLFFFRYQCLKNGMVEMALFFKALFLRALIISAFILVLMALPYKVINLYLNRDFPVLHHRGLLIEYAEKSFRLSEQKKYREALEYADMSMESYRIGWPKDSLCYYTNHAYSDAYAGLMEECIKDGNYDRAIEYYKSAAVPVQIYNGDTSDRAAQLKIYMGYIYAAKRDYPRADSFMLDAMRIYKFIGNTGMEYATMESYAQILKSRGYYLYSIRLYKAIIYEMRDSLKARKANSDNDEIAYNLNNEISRLNCEIGWAYSLDNKYDSADLYFDLANKNVHFDKAPNYAYCLSKLAMHQMRKGRLLPAKQLIVKALNLFPKSESKTSYEYLFAMNCKIELELLLADTREADQSCTTVLNEISKSGNARNKKMIIFMSLFSEVKIQQARYDTAKILLHQLLTYYDDNSSEYANTLRLLSSLNGDLYLLDEAISESRKATAIMSEQFEDKYTNVALSMFYRNEAYIDYLSNDIIAARKLYQISFAIDTQRNADRINLAATLNGMGLMAQRDARYKQANTFFDIALVIFSSYLGESNPQYATVLYNKAMTKLSEGMDAESEKLLASAQNIHISALGDDHDKVADDLAGLGDLKFKQKRYGQALDYFEKAFAIYSSKFRADHPKTIQTQKMIGICKKKI